jgi:hypothetical protein
MKRAGQVLGICAVVLGCGWATSTRAYQSPDAKAALTKDATCTGCHLVRLRVLKSWQYSLEWRESLCESSS